MQHTKTYSIDTTQLEHRARALIQPVATPAGRIRAALKRTAPASATGHSILYVREGDFTDTFNKLCKSFKQSEIVSGDSLGEFFEEMGDDRISSAQAALLGIALGYNPDALKEAAKVKLPFTLKDAHEKWKKIVTAKHRQAADILAAATYESKDIDPELAIALGAPRSRDYSRGALLLAGSSSAKFGGDLLDEDDINESLPAEAEEGEQPSAAAGDDNKPADAPSGSAAFDTTDTSSLLQGGQAALSFMKTNTKNRLEKLGKDTDSNRLISTMVRHLLEDLMKRYRDHHRVPEDQVIAHILAAAEITRDQEDFIVANKLLSEGHEPVDPKNAKVVDKIVAVLLDTQDPKDILPFTDFIFSAKAVAPESLEGQAAALTITARELSTRLRRDISNAYKITTPNYIPDRDATLGAGMLNNLIVHNAPLNAAVTAPVTTRAIAEHIARKVMADEQGAIDETKAMELATLIETTRESERLEAGEFKKFGPKTLEKLLDAVVIPNTTPEARSQALEVWNGERHSEASIKNYFEIHPLPEKPGPSHRSRASKSSSPSK